jgi:hypothetical protein
MQLIDRSPLGEITNVGHRRMAKANDASTPDCRRGEHEAASRSPEETTPAPRCSSESQQGVRRGVYQHNPYAWGCVLRDSPEPERPSDTDLGETTAVTMSPMPVAECAVPAGFAQATDAALVPCVPTLCTVQFRHHQMEHVATIPVTPGQYVLVTGDRGQDMGLVVRLLGSAGAEGGGVCMGSVLRPAYQREVEYLNGELRMQEEAAAESCRAKARRLGLQMELHHAEYQYDRKKLTFYYDSRGRVDFVSLLRELFRDFGCRIWMEKVRRPAQRGTRGDSE